MAVLAPKQLSELIKTGEYPRCILIYGEEEFLMDQFLGIVKRKCIAEGAETMDYVKIDCEGKEMDPEQVRANIELPAWMSPKRVVYVKNADIFGKKDTDRKKKGDTDKKEKNDKTDVEKIEKLLKDVPDTGILIISTSKIDNRKKALLKAFTDNGVVSEFAFQPEDKLSNTISKKLARSGLRADEETLLSIVSRCNKSLRLIDGEVNKIVLYCQGAGMDTVTMDVVEDLCPPDIQGKIFQITDAIGARNAQAALIYTDNLIKTKEPLPRIRVMIARQIKLLICAKEIGNKDEIIKRLKVQDFVARNLLKQSRNFNHDKLIKIYMDLYQADADIKKGLADERMSLDTLIVKACS